MKEKEMCREDLENSQFIFAKIDKICTIGKNVMLDG